jgi:hypothetical protein
MHWRGRGDARCGLLADGRVGGSAMVNFTQNGLRGRRGKTCPLLLLPEFFGCVRRSTLKYERLDRPPSKLFLNLHCRGLPGIGALAASAVALVRSSASHIEFSARCSRRNHLARFAAEAALARLSAPRLPLVRNRLRQQPPRYPVRARQAAICCLIGLEKFPVIHAGKMDSDPRQKLYRGLVQPGSYGRGKCIFPVFSR